MRVFSLSSSLSREFCPHGRAKRNQDGGFGSHSVLDLTRHVIFDKSFSMCLNQVFSTHKGAVLQLLPAVMPAG